MEPVAGTVSGGKGANEHNPCPAETSRLVLRSAWAPGQLLQGSEPRQDLLAGPFPTASRT